MRGTPTTAQSGRQEQDTRIPQNRSAAASTTGIVSCDGGVELDPTHRELGGCVLGSHAANDNFRLGSDRTLTQADRERHRARRCRLIFEELAVAGAYVIRQERRGDDRGYFARVWCQSELSAKGLVGRIEQINTAYSPRAGTLRGLHYQLPPHAEVKIARCTRGAAFDVVIDLRRGSLTYRRWDGERLSAEDGTQLYVPEGCAHGYLTLEDGTELVYSTSAAYAPSSARGVRHDEAQFGVAWPAAVRMISDQDQQWPPHQPADAVVV